jgi:hypothetical protein
MLKKLVRRFLFVVVCLVTLVALSIAIENWRGKAAWMKYQGERMAKGDRFEWSAIVPPPVPDDQNVAAAPVFAELFPKLPENYRLKPLALPSCANSAGNWSLGSLENLSGWRAAFTNENLLEALSRYQPLLREVEAALRRPKCKFPLRYEDTFGMNLPHVSVIRKTVQVYRLRALAELEAGQPEAAFADVQTCLRLADCLKEEPLLISLLVRASIIEGALQPVWEGLASHRWTDAQLEAFQGGFSRQEWLEHFVLSCQCERMCAYSVTQLCLKDRKQLVEMIRPTNGMTGSQSPSIERFIGMLFPSGWLYRNNLGIDRWYTEQLIPAIDLRSRRIDARVVLAMDPAFQEMRMTPYNFLLKILVPAVGGLSKKVARSQTSGDLATVACALERYRLAQGRLPAKLDELMPHYLAAIPCDVIDGQPLRYKRTGADQFMLYSVGWNGIDDGGQLAFTGEGRNRRLDEAKGDWIWRSQPE